jgi:hypothetical protein
MSAILSRSLLLLSVILAGCVSAPFVSFEEAHHRADLQPHDVAYAYEDKWDKFNNDNNLDERDGCYQKATGITQQVLVLDNMGMVTEVLADIDNAKSRCFRQTYLHAKFPAPPFAPYYMYLKMH